MRVYFGGLTIREHFAAMAMQGLVSRAALPDDCASWSTDWYQRAAIVSVGMADMLIAELAKR